VEREGREGGKEEEGRERRRERRAIEERDTLVKVAQKLLSQSWVLIFLFRSLIPPKI
jgi:hypothetical protein